MDDAALSRTFVLVHGGWRGGWCWQRVAERLRKRGHRVFAPTLTGLGERSHLRDSSVCLDTHVKDVLHVLQSESLGDVVLVGHSYGGCVISAVAEHAAASIGSIVFLDAFVPEDGESVADLAGENVRNALIAARSRGETNIAPMPAAMFRVNEVDRA